MFDEKTILALQDRIAEDHKADQAAIRRVLQLLKRTGLVGGVKAVRARADKPTEVYVRRNGRGHFEDAGAVSGFSLANPSPVTETAEDRILSVIKNFDAPFTFSDLQGRVSEKFGPMDRKTVSWTIYRNKDKHIKVIQEGRGRRKAIYEKI